MSSSNHNLRIALLWNGTVFQEHTFTQTSEPVITAGSHESNMFVVETSAIPEKFPMFERAEDGYRLRLTDKLEGDVSIGGEDYDIEELLESKEASKVGDAYEVLLKFRGGDENDYGQLQFGDVIIFFQMVGKGDAVPARGMGDRVDAPVLLTLFLSMVGHVAFVLIAFLLFEVDPSLDDMQNLDRFVRYAVEDVDDPPEEEEVEEPEEDTTGKKAGGEEGQFGDPEEDIPESKIPKVDGEMVDEIDVKNIGINKALSADVLGAGPLKNIFANSEGFDSKMNVAMSGEGGDLQIGRGAGGMGMRGVGGGGGGEGFGRVGGLGKVDTGGGKGTGAKIGRKAEKKVKSRVETGAPNVGEFCDPANVRRVVNQRQSAIKHCFEKELQTNPTLSGKITARWNINLEGGVESATITETTMNHAGVEGCITRVLARLRFEKPDGGICVIQYPFVFSGLDE